MIYLQLKKKSISNQTIETTLILQKKNNIYLTKIIYNLKTTKLDNKYLKNIHIKK